MEAWSAECTCPGSDRLRAVAAKAQEIIDALQAQQAEVLANVAVGSGHSAGEIQRRILSSYEAAGYVPPTDYARWSRFIAAGTGRRGTRTLRLLGETASALRAARRWAPAGREGIESRSSEARQRDARNAKELQRVERTFAVCTAIAVGAAAAAHLTKGVARVVLTVLATTLASLAAGMGLWAFGIGVVVHAVRGWPESSERSP